MSGIQSIALGVDVREGEYLANLVETLQELRARGHQADVLFLEASEQTLVTRYKETRRRHPLAPEGSVSADSPRRVLGGGGSSSRIRRRISP